MNQPVLSIDIAKGKSIAVAFTSYGMQVKKPFSFLHSPYHISSLLPILVQLEEATMQQPTVVMEATGNYSKPVASFFFSHGYPVFMLNPLTTHELKKRSTRKVKTDPIDAIRIANAFYLGEGTPLIPVNEKVTELRFLCRQHAQWKALLGEVQLQFCSILDLAFPGYDKAFQNIFNPSSIQLLTKFPSPSALLDADKEDVLTILMLNRRGRTWNEEKYSQLIEIARHSLPDLYGSKAHVFAMQNSMMLLKTYQEGITSLEKSNGFLSPRVFSLPSVTLDSWRWADYSGNDPRRNWGHKKVPFRKTVDRFCRAGFICLRVGNLQGEPESYFKTWLCLSPHRALPSIR
jgi:transposase